MDPPTAPDPDPDRDLETNRFSPTPEPATPPDPQRQLDLESKVTVMTISADSVDIPELESYTDAENLKTALNSRTNNVTTTRPCSFVVAEDPSDQVIKALQECLNISSDEFFVSHYCSGKSGYLKFPLGPGTRGHGNYR